VQSVKRETKNFERIVSTEFRRIGPSTLLAVGLWYWLGAVLGLGVALGTVVAGLIAPVRAGIFLAAILAAAAGYGLALIFVTPFAALSGAVGGVAGAVAIAQLCRRTLTRGGTRGATGALIFFLGLIVGGLAFVPALGYLEAGLVVLLALRLRRGGAGRYAGLRTLARD
jgi:membrane associated rhomboid family serine protease